MYVSVLHIPPFKGIELLLSVHYFILFHTPHTQQLKQGITIQQLKQCIIVFNTFELPQMVDLSLVSFSICAHTHSIHPLMDACVYPMICAFSEFSLTSELPLYSAQPSFLADHHHTRSTHTPVYLCVLHTVQTQRMCAPLWCYQFFTAVCTQHD